MIDVGELHQEAQPLQVERSGRSPRFPYHPRFFRKIRVSKKRSQVPRKSLVRTNPSTSQEGPFGEVIRATGPAVSVNPFQFSTKYRDAETGLLNYGFRILNVTTGRWLSRDPIGEEGGRNLQGFVYNNPVSLSDHLGQNPTDLVAKIAGRQVPKAWGINAGGFAMSKVPGLSGIIAGGATAVTFFPDSCEIASFSVRAGIGNTVADWKASTAEDVGSGYEAGLAAGTGAGIEVAVYYGNSTPRIANARSFVGIFHTLQAGGKAGEIPIGVGAYIGNKDKVTGGNWVGGTIGIGLGAGVPVSVIDWNYQLMDGTSPVPVPKCLCYAAILAMP